MYAKSIELLNRAVGDELTAVHQYMYFHFHCEDQGLDLLSALFFRTAIEEMQHVERCAERILFLGGEAVRQQWEYGYEFHTPVAHVHRDTTPSPLFPKSLQRENPRSENRISSPLHLL